MSTAVETMIPVRAAEASRIEASSSAWPVKHRVVNVDVSIVTYDDAVEAVLAAAERRESAVVSCHAVHAIVTCGADPQLREHVNRFEMITPDGQPVRSGLNRLHGARLRDRVYGPELTLRICRAAAERGVGIYLYGGSPDTIGKLCDNLLRQFPNLNIAGSESPPFRPLTPEEDRDVVERINASGAGIVFIGLGCPKQDRFAAEHRDRIQAVQICVGAAFDFHAGKTSMAPGWMQRNGLEWLYRLCQEPRRLWRRYFVTNTVFVTAIFRQWVRSLFRA